MPQLREVEPVTVTRRAVEAMAVVGLAVALAGCAPATQTPPTGPATVPVPPPARDAPPPGMTLDDGFNVVDIVFLQQMIPHHQLALRMADMAITRASSPGVKDLARQLAIDSAEVQQMSDTLASLGINPGLATFGGHAHGGGPTAQDLAVLATLSGARFDDSFRDLLMRHSLSATELARAETKQGNNASTRRLAAQIATRESNLVITLERMQ